MKFKHIALVGKYQATTLTKQIIELANYLVAHGFVVYVDCGEYCDYQDFSGLHKGKLVDWVEVLDLVIVVGGDGTLLSAARIIVDHDIPVIGINQGKLGFMTDVAANEMLDVIESVVIKEQYTIETRSILAAKVIRKNKVVASSVALNDVVISRGAIGNMIEFDITIHEQFVLAQKSDGVIFATPTGSTAYSLAAGGPILHPGANVFAIVPICPQSLSNRPLVVSDDEVIEFTLIRENSTQIHFDGQECFGLCYEDKVLLSKHPKQLKLMHPYGYNYYRTLRKKLDWSKRVS